MDIHEVRPEEIEDYVTLRNEIFTGGPVPAEWWRSLYKAHPRSMTGIIAVEDGETLGSVSYLLKDLQVGSGKTLKAAFANAVGVAEKARSMGLGSRMHKAALEVLPSYSDALMVVISESQKAYPYYRRNGYVLLHAPDRFDCPLEAVERTPPAEVTVGEGWDLYRENEAAVLGIFRQTYDGCGGFYMHEPGWLESLKGHHDSNDDSINRATLRTILATEGGTPAAYVLLRLPAKEGGAAQINEFAARNADTRPASAAIAGALAVARQEGADTCTMYGSLEHPLNNVLSVLDGKHSRSLGFFGQPIDAQRTATAVYGDLLHNAGITLDLSFKCSDQEASVSFGSGPAYVRLAMEYEDWVRALFRRTSLLAGLLGGRITLLDGSLSTVRAAEAAAGPLPWVYLGSTYT